MLFSLVEFQPHLNLQLHQMSILTLIEVWHFSYNTSSGAGNNKQGFFGFHDLAGDASNAPERSFYLHT